MVFAPFFKGNSALARTTLILNESLHIVLISKIIPIKLM
jgi:hypothetical protein